MSLLPIYTVGFYSIVGFSNLKQISISSNVSNTAVRKSIELTCFARFGSSDSSRSTVRYLWSGPATNDNWSNRILSLHNIHLSEAGEYKCSASLHNSSITAGIPVVLQCK